MIGADMVAVFLAPALPLPRTRPRPLIGGGLVPVGAALDAPSAAVAVLLAALPTTFCFLVLRDGELVDAYDSPFFLLRLGEDGAADDMADAAVANADMASAAIMAAISLSLSSLFSFSLGIPVLAVFGTIAASALPFPFFLVLADFFSELPPVVDFFLAFLVGVGVVLPSSLALALALALFRAQ